MRFRRRPHPRAGRRDAGSPPVVSPPAPDAPRAGVEVPPPALPAGCGVDYPCPNGQHALPAIAPAQSGDVLDDLWDRADPEEYWVDESTVLPPELAQAVLRRPELALVPALPDDQEELAGLPESRAQTLERLTDLWVRQARIAGAGPDATMFYAASPPPPPARKPAAVEELVLDLPKPPEPEDLRPDGLEPAPPAGNPPVSESPQIVRDWASRHDVRSLEFDVRSRLTASVSLQDRVWELGPVFDQGTTPPLPLRDASGCVGMATSAAANVLALASRPFSTIATPSGLLTKEDALGLYARAQELDHVSGSNYAGTSVLAGMLAGREAGLWSGFLWAFGTKDVAQAVLQVGPVVIGIPWGPSLDDPDPGGVIVPGDDLDAGHALAVVGILAKLPARVTARSVAGRATPGPYFVLQQSRGEGHGDAGRVYLHHSHLAGLLAGVGEAAIPLPHYPSGVLS